MNDFSGESGTGSLESYNMRLLFYIININFDFVPIYASFVIDLKVVMLSLAWKLKAEQMGFFTVNEWVRGMTELQ